MTPDRFRVLRRHDKPLAYAKCTYEVYDPENHCVHLCQWGPSVPYDTIRLHPDETVADYLRTTAETQFYEEPTEEEAEAFFERFLEPVRHVCDDDYTCEKDDCRYCGDDGLFENGERFLVDSDDNTD